MVNKIVETTKPRWGKTDAYRKNIAAVTNTSIIFLPFGQIAWNLGKKINQIEELNKKKAIIYGNPFGPITSEIKLNWIIDVA